MVRVTGTVLTWAVSCLLEEQMFKKYKAEICMGIIAIVLMIGWITISISIGISVDKGIKHVQEKGLKNIIVPIWEGQK